jgi:hypothetical protein
MGMRRFREGTVVANVPTGTMFEEVQATGEIPSSKYNLGRVWNHGGARGYDSYVVASPGKPGKRPWLYWPRLGKLEVKLDSGEFVSVVSAQLATDLERLKKTCCPEGTV